VFLSHSSRDNRQAVAVMQWLIEQEPGLAEEIFLDLDPHTGIRPGERWRQALQQANARCEAVICLLSKHWEASRECQTEFRYAENLGKTILCARLEPVPDTNITSEWQRCDLFSGDGCVTEVTVDAGAPVELATEGLQRLLDALRALGIGAEHFPWSDPDRPPYRGWAPLDEADAAVFFGRDAQIIRGLDVLRRVRSSGVESVFVVLGPSGAGKSSFLRAGLLPRLRRDDRRFVPLGIVRPESDVLAGANGFAKAIYAARRAHGLTAPALGDIETACAEQPQQIRQLLVELQETAQAQLLERSEDTAPPTLVLPLDQAEELLSAEGESQAELFLRLVRDLVAPSQGERLDLIVAASIRTDRFEGLQTRPELADIGIEAFAELKPMPPEQFKEVITGPADRATQAGRPLELSPDLVNAILEDCKEGSDTLPLLSLTLSRLYDKYGSSGQLALAHYEKMGGLRRVVQTVIDAILDPNPEVRGAQLESLRMAFIPWLVTINPVNDKPMRRVARWSDLPEASRPLIDGFVANRLMVKDKRGGEDVAEVALESLLRQWDDLAGWLDEETENLTTADDVQRATAAWEASGRDQAWLLAGSRLAAADAVTQLPGYRQLLAHAGDFLAASRQRAHERGGQKEPVISTAGFVCLLAGVVALSIGIASVLLVPWVWHITDTPDTAALLGITQLVSISATLAGVGLLVRRGGRVSPGTTVWGCAVVTTGTLTLVFSLWNDLAKYAALPGGLFTYVGLYLTLIAKWRTPPLRTMALGYFVAGAAVLLLVVFDGASVPVKAFERGDIPGEECSVPAFQGPFLGPPNCFTLAAASLFAGVVAGVVLIAAGVFRVLQQRQSNTGRVSPASPPEVVAKTTAQRGQRSSEPKPEPMVKKLLLGTWAKVVAPPGDEDFWFDVGIDPIRIITFGGAFLTLRCYLDDAPIFLGSSGRINVFRSGRALRRYLADNPNNDMSSLSTYRDITIAANNLSLRADEVTEDNVYMLNGLSEDIAAGPDQVDREQLECAVALLRDVGKYTKNSLVEDYLQTGRPLGDLVESVLVGDDVPKQRRSPGDASLQWAQLEDFLESRLRQM
jgi:hypothetical protein